MVLVNIPSESLNWILQVLNGHFEPGEMKRICIYQHSFSNDLPAVNMMGSVSVVIRDFMADIRPLLLYIHGFNSSPLSVKAQELKRYIEKHNVSCDYIVPELPEWPGESARQLFELANSAIAQQPVYIIGSSLGGYYGTWLMERLLENELLFPVKLVLINPAVEPYKLFADYLGPQKNYYNGHQYELTQEHIEQLQHLEVAALHRPDNILLLAQKGDETLDYRKAEARYQDCPQRIDEGGDHGYQNFAETIPMIFSFFSPLLVPKNMPV